MTLDNIIYENIPASYTVGDADATTNVTIDMVADRSLPEGLYLIKFVGGAYIADVGVVSTSLTTTYIKLLKHTSLISFIHPTSLDRCEWTGTNYISNSSVLSPNSYTYILTNSAAKPIKLNYYHRKTSNGHYYNTTGTFVFQKLRDLNSGEE